VYSNTFEDSFIFMLSYLIFWITNCAVVYFLLCQENPYPSTNTDISKTIVFLVCWFFIFLVVVGPSDTQAVIFVCL